MSVDGSRLQTEWRIWLAENLALGVPEEDVRQVLADAGVEPGLASQELEVLRAHPYFQACQRLARHYGGLEALLDVYSDLRREDAGRELERRKDLGAEEFFARYYFGHRPVVLQGMMEDWPARSRWSMKDLAARFGHVVVEVMTNRDTNPDHASQYERHRTQMTFAEYLRRVETGGETNDHYMVPRNDNWRREGLRGLTEDVRAPRGIIDPSLNPDMLTLLLGPAGTVTPLHHDNLNVLLGQVMGRKHVKLIPSFERHRVYPRKGTFSHVDAASPEMERYPLFAEATILETVLEPGEMVFIPVGWWHWVRALDVSASVTFHQFQIPGGNTHLSPPP
ncbi:cupin-like domain-containing protein [Corallococcus sp. H22C18031201]|nr:cupin-like domain-containing protein [Corallococcus sp. H22C18031201]